MRFGMLIIDNVAMPPWYTVECLIICCVGSATYLLPLCSQASLLLGRFSRQWPLYGESCIQKE
jgi:hypothetical protein